MVRGPPKSHVIHLLIHYAYIGPVQNPTTDVFDDFDDEQGQNLLGSLHLEADEEPVRRGASRANSVRFDVSAIQGSNWAHGSRNSGDFGPVRPGSGIGSHPMTERSLSHKSDGRHSSAGHSVHSMHSNPSGRTSSLGLDTNFIIGGQDDDDSPLDIPDPPPGLFILGTVPSIIRCWLTTNFSHNALLYADVCSGSQRSMLDYGLLKDLGLSSQIQKNANGRHSIRLSVYLPEAIITHPTSRSNSPAPQLPTLSADFEVISQTQRGPQDRKEGIRVFLGSDILRAHNADILFSQNLMTLYGDDRNKLSVPFVRPEDETIFKNLSTANIPPERNELKATALPFTPTESKSKVEVVTGTSPPVSSNGIAQSNKDKPVASTSTVELQSPLNPPRTSDPSVSHQISNAKAVAPNLGSSSSDSGKPQPSEGTEHEASDTRTSSDSTRRDSSVGIWGSWRQGSANGGENGREIETTSGYQRATRGGGRSMKILKPSSKPASKPTSTARSASRARTGSAYEPAPPPRGSAEMRRKSQAENVPLKWEQKRISSEEQKRITTVPRSENPVGGASAFAWMNPGNK